MVSTLGITSLSAPVATVAKAMINASLDRWQGLQVKQETNAEGTMVEILENAQILKLGGDPRSSEAEL